VQEATGAAFLFGHSFGGLVALETARMNNLFTKIALYEPGVSIKRSIPTTWLPKYEKALNKNDTYGAFAIFVRALGPCRRAPPTGYPLTDPSVNPAINCRCINK
jgi:pimeloyl-ACP methyl ester carboxylesterase